ncbi:MAG TPA: relaxase/mobilization nuclease domain-containing protein [Acetobacteraceae bacterium]|nr:relaxase/mobilization nuclease domain-containing protein [Acetobacteraceae bacterium]
MIIKGKSRAGPQQLAKHLGNAEKNERVSLLEAKGTVAQDLRGALVEMDAYAAGTRCEKPLYHAAISPEPPHRLTPEQRSEAIDALEQRLGLVGHARVVVMHEKLGREHIHVVWSRIDLEKMRSVSDSHNYRKHEEVARDLERRFGHERVQGAHHERDGVERPDRTPSRAELQQQERTGITGKRVKAEVTAAFRASDGPEAFRAALEEKGYILAKGDRRDHVVIDPFGGVHSLARRIEGMKAAELRAFMAPIDKASLPSIEEAREIAADRAQRARERLASERDISIEKAYARGDDYVSQTQAALKDHQRRQEKLQQGKETKSSRIEVDPDALKHEEIRDQDDRRRRQAEEEVTGRKESSARARRSSPSGNVEMTKEQQERMERLLNRDDTNRSRDRDDWPPDRRPEAPGGGRTRGR